MDNPIVDLGERFLASGMKGIEVQGINQMMQETYNELNMPIDVRIRRNKIYLLRREDAASEDTT